MRRLILGPVLASRASWRETWKNRSWHWPRAIRQRDVARWTLRLLAGQVVQLELLDEVSHESVRKVLKKTA